MLSTPEGSAAARVAGSVDGLLSFVGAACRAFVREKWPGLKLSSACPSGGPLASCSSCWDVPYPCTTNTGPCSSSSSTSCLPSLTASRGEWSTTRTRPATPAKSWPSSSRRASSSRRSACPSSSPEPTSSPGGRVRSCSRATSSSSGPSWASSWSLGPTTTSVGSSGKAAEEEETLVRTVFIIIIIIIVIIVLLFGSCCYLYDDRPSIDSHQTSAILSFSFFLFLFSACIILN